MAAAAAAGEGLGQLWSSRGKNGDRAAEDWMWRKDLSAASHCCQLSDNMHEWALGGGRWQDGKKAEQN